MLLSPVTMHIPDGFLSVLISIVFWIVAALSVGYALKRVNAHLDDRLVPLMGVLAAAIFAGQMLNFTVAGGTSGHLMGAALATILLGPWAGIVVMSCVVGVQALVFQDGGLLVLGANLFNMGIVGVVVAHVAYRMANRLTGRWARGRIVSGFVAGWTSIFVASLAVGLQLALSGTSPASVAIPTMAGIHALIGLGEGAITAGALAFIYVARRDLIEHAEAPVASGTVVWIGGVAIAVLLATLAPLASAHPDGLEWAAERLGFLDVARAPVYTLLPDYLVPGIKNEGIATVIAGIIGVAIVLAAALTVVRTRRHSGTAS